MLVVNLNIFILYLTEYDHIIFLKKYSDKNGLLDILLYTVLGVV